ncbi:MAG: HAMP domain-containing protein [Planctomycetota bacterium]|nr:MAG: HAMP domain-containing protein [Planctomycetota bacterium]
MSLRSKIVLVLTGVVLLYVGIDNFVQRVMVTKSFEELEREEAIVDLNRAVEAFEHERESLYATGRAWAAWVDRSRGPGGALDTSLFSSQMMAAADVHLVFVCEADGEASGTVVWGRIEDPETRTPISLRNFPKGALDPIRLGLFPRSDIGTEDERPGFAEVGGFLVTQRGPMIVSSHSTRAASDASDTTDGHRRIILGRFVGDDMVRRLGRIALVAFKVWPIDGDLPPRERELLERIMTASGPIVDPVDDGQLHVYTTVQDLQQLPSLLLRADVGREISARGIETIRYSLLSALATALLILLVLLFLLQRIVIRPLSRLTNHAVTIGRSDDTSAKMDMKGDDEIALLSREFDRMIGKLAISREEIIKTARLAGMSEVASGVLHNVGNVLNSVGISSSVVVESLESFSITDLELMVDVLKENEHNLAHFVTNDERGKHLIFYFSALTETLGFQKDSALKEMSSLTQGIDHIKQLVQAQQKITGKVGFRERLSLEKVFDEALDICQQAFGRKDIIEIVRDYQAVPDVKSDKHKLMEIVINLIQNARQAMRSNGSRAKVLTLRLRRVDAEWACMEVQDTGMGISRENLARVFNLGFTTKKDGHGFGLHVSANSATEMNAYLSVHSEGPNRGATFKLTVPLKALPKKPDDSVLGRTVKA